MKVFNPLVTGGMGSGKTTLVRHLVARTPRCFIMDKMGDYLPESFRAADLDPDRAVVQSYGELVDVFRDVRDGDFQVVLYHHDTDVQLAGLELVYRTLEREGGPPVGIIMEEASFYSTTGSMPEVVEEVGTKGRHVGTSVVYVVQRDTQVHPILQANATAIVALRQRKFSRWMRDIFTGQERDFIQTLEPVEHPRQVPRRGRHYWTDPPEVDVVESWVNAVT